MILGYYIRLYSKFKLNFLWYMLYNNECYLGFLIFILCLFLEIFGLFYVGVNGDILVFFNLYEELNKYSFFI